jgi:hypothetical protein
MVRLVVCLLVLASAPARAEEGRVEAPDAIAAAPAPAEQPPPTPLRPEAKSRWGLLLDAGVPGGVSLSVVYRPTSIVRLWAGPAWNYVAWGAQGGVALVPWHFVVSPVLSGEVGRFFGADVSFLTRTGDAVPDGLRPLLESMTYTYAAAHLGLDFGSQRRFLFSLRAGLSYVAFDTRGTATVSEGAGSTVTFSDPRIRGTLPSVKLGLHYWF